MMVHRGVSKVNNGQKYKQQSERLYVRNQIETAIVYVANGRRGRCAANFILNKK